MNSSAMFVGVNLSAGAMAVVERRGWTHPESDPMTWSFRTRPVFRIRAAEQFAPETPVSSLMAIAERLASNGRKQPVSVFVNVSGTSAQASDFPKISGSHVVVLNAEDESGNPAGQFRERLICPEHIPGTERTLAAARLALRQACRQDSILKG